MCLTNVIVIAAILYPLNAAMYIRKDFIAHNDDADYITMKSSTGHGLADAFSISFLSEHCYIFVPVFYA